MYSRLKQLYKKHRNFICTIFYMLLSGYVGMIEITSESKPIAGIIIFMIGFHFMEKFFVHEVWEKKK